MEGLAPHAIGELGRLMVRRTSILSPLTVGTCVGAMRKRDSAVVYATVLECP